ncbi:MAG TPA: cyclase dehydrase, partial [Propylenella sp.]|nr:cyclase dehydrase [Propylenella sp.]
REVATGMGILASRDPAPWIWGRVGGDALDVATLAAGLSRDNARRQNIGLAIASVLGVTALDVVCAMSLSSQDGRRPRLPVRDYRDRSGFPRGTEEMRGAARDFEVPADMRTPEPLRLYAR